MKSLAPALSKYASDQINLNMAVGRFYDQNQDLLNYRPLVQWKANMVHSQNPGMPVDQLLQKVGQEVRQLINPQQQATQQPQNQNVGVAPGGQTPQNLQPQNIQPNPNVNAPQPNQSVGVQGQQFGGVPGNSSIFPGVRVAGQQTQNIPPQQKEINELVYRNRR